MALDCRTCMACCLYEGLLPIVQLETDGAPLSIAAKDDLICRSDAKTPEDSQRCIWLVIENTGTTDDPCGKCEHYEHRPKICRDFKVGGEVCRKMREYKAANPILAH